MRNLDRDRRAVLIARYLGMSDGVDEQGRLTGRPSLSYADPVEVWPTATPARGQATGDVFGLSLEYDKVLTFDDPGFEVSETDLLWVDDLGSEEHDHKVVRVARSGSYTLVAASRVEVSA